MTGKKRKACKRLECGSFPWDARCELSTPVHSEVLWKSG